MAKALVVYYSRTGVTRAAAQYVASAIRGDIEEVVDHERRRGPVGYLRCGYQAYFEQTPRIDPPRFDPHDYDLVVVASPIWNASLASPMRTYVEENRARMPELAVVLTCGGMGIDRVTRQIEAASRHYVRFRVALTDSDRRDGEDHRKLRGFVEAIADWLTLREARFPAASSPSFA